MDHRVKPGGDDVFEQNSGAKKMRREDDFAYPPPR
jgi:hypothetical protein